MTGESLLSQVRDLRTKHGWGKRKIGPALGIGIDVAHRLLNKLKLEDARRDGVVPAIIEPNPQTASQFARRISAAWRRGVEAIIDTGHWLGRAKDALDYGEFGTMIESELPFSASTAQRLMAISADPRLTNPAHVQHLPPHWGTLYELTKLNDHQFSEGISKGLIRPDMERKALINGARTVMASRVEPDDSLDYFPTPPWATRALMEMVLPHIGITNIGRTWEPACGEGHMSRVLEEYTNTVFASDIFDYGTDGQRVQDFLAFDDPGNPWGADHPIIDWVITNPPFGDKSIEFVCRALDVAFEGVAMFFRSQWAVEGQDRYEKLFKDRPPTLCAFFVERVNLCKGRWDPDGSTATAYCWLVWVKDRTPLPPFWIPPGCRESLTKPDDRKRFAAWSMPNQAEAAEQFQPQDKGAHRAEAGNPERPNVIEGDGPASHSDQAEVAE